MPISQRHHDDRLFTPYDLKIPDMFNTAEEFHHPNLSIPRHLCILFPMNDSLEWLIFWSRPDKSAPAGFTCWSDQTRATRYTLIYLRQICNLLN